MLRASMLDMTWPCRVIAGQPIIHRAQAGRLVERPVLRKNTMMEVMYVFLHRLRQTGYGTLPALVN